MAELSVIKRLPEIIRNCERTFDDILKKPYVERFTYEEVIMPNDEEKVPVNEFYQGDNLLAMERLLKNGYRGKIDLIYIDPPFMTKSNQEGKIVIKDGEKDYAIEQVAYEDNWDEGIVSYLNMLCPRLYLMRELLSEKGTLYVHLDYRTVHYVKILLDCIFGVENFLNEIIWAYKSGGVSNRYYSRKHDTILVYTKTKDYIFNPQKEKSYNRDFKPYRFKGVEEYQDELGWYTLVNLKDVWQIDMVGRTSKERVGYATQKPEKLLERIILTSSNEDSIVADFFAGSGTTGVVAERLNRRWIMSDSGDLSSITVYKRIMDNPLKAYRSFKEKGKIRNGGKLLVKDAKIDDDVLNIQLNRYMINIDHLNIKEKYKLKIEELIHNNSLALIDFIGLDLDYDGQVPLISKKIVRTDNKTIDSFIAIKGIFKEGQKIFVRYVDVFGKGNFDIYQIANGRMILCQEY